MPAGLYAFYGLYTTNEVRITEIANLKEYALKITLKEFIESIYSAALLEKR